MQHTTLSIMDDLRVLIVANDPLARTGLATLLANQPECTVVGQVAGEADLADEVAVYRPDVVVWDLGWDPTPALPTLRRAGLERLADLGDGQLPIVALLSDETHAANTWTAGARGLLLRDTDAENLVAALLAVAQGLVVLDPDLAATVLPTRNQPPEPPVKELTPRELEVLQLLAEGLPNKAIAYRLGISQHTVKGHVNAILGKLRVQSRTEAVVRATRLWLIIL